jgi:predicted anti-sigma-YlaC factor YlaD
MLCVDFETLLTDYIEGVTGSETNRQMAEHAMKCPVCHETLSAVKSTVEACRMASVPEPSRDLDARILQKTAPQTAMTCEEFEEFLTDYLDGFLPANLYHRWERHAAVCERCTELPGEVVRSIGACYTYISEEKPLPEGLHERILQATLGTATPQEIKAPWTARAASRFRLWLDPIISPQLVSVYDAGLALAERTGAQSQVLQQQMSLEQTTPPPAPPQQKQNNEQNKDSSNGGGRPESNGHKGR